MTRHCLSDIAAVDTRNACTKYVGPDNNELRQPDIRFEILISRICELWKWIQTQRSVYANFPAFLLLSTVSKFTTWPLQPSGITPKIPFSLVERAMCVLHAIPFVCYISSMCALHVERERTHFHRQQPEHQTHTHSEWLCIVIAEFERTPAFATQSTHIFLVD